METYRRVIGPNYYSFNLGQFHFVVLDDIVYTGVNTYNTYVEDVQLAWLERDLSYIDASTPIVVLTHAPLFRYTGMADGVLQMGKDSRIRTKWIGCWKNSASSSVYTLSRDTPTRTISAAIRTALPNRTTLRQQPRHGRFTVLRNAI